MIKSETYVYDQDIQNRFNGLGIVLPEISDKDSFDYFRSENITSKIQESVPITIAQSKVQETILETIPRSITYNDVPNKMKDKILGVTVHFIKYLDDKKLDISPKY